MGLGLDAGNTAYPNPDPLTIFWKAAFFLVSLAF